MPKITEIEFLDFPSTKKNKMKIHIDEWVGIIVLGSCVMWGVLVLLGV